MASFEEFCDSISRMQHGLFWEIARHSPVDVDDVRMGVNSMELDELRAHVRDVAADLMLCPSGRWALRHDLLNWEKAAKVLRLVSILSRPRLVLALHVAHHTTPDSEILPFSYYASFLLALCDARLDFDPQQMLEPEPATHEV
jgi:hypothetical protein